MNNLNFGYDCRNNLDNCKFVPIFDELREITYINQYHNVFDQKVSQFVTTDLMKKQIEENYNDKLMKLDKEDRFYEIKLQTLKNERLSSLEAAEKIDQSKKKNKRKANLIDYSERKNEALINQKVKSLIDFDDQYSASIKSIAIQKESKIHLTTRFLNGKMLMFSKVSIKSFVYELIDIFMLPTDEIKKIDQKYKVNQCYLDQNLTDTDSTSIFFVFICDLKCNVREDEARNIIFEVMLKSKVFDRLDLSAEYYDKFNCRNESLKKRVGFFEVENIDTPNIITIALNPKEYYERFADTTDNKKHKGLKKSTPYMDFDSYSSRLSDLTEYYSEFVTKPNPVKQIEQKRFQIINESMQMKSVSKVQFGQLNDKRFYFANGILSLPYGHPLLEKVRKQKDKYRDIHKVIQTKKEQFLKEETKVIENIPRLNILNQIFNQVPLIYELESETNFLKSGWNTTKDYIKNGSWK